MIKILSVFPNTMTRFMPSLFSATWAELNSAKSRYAQDFITGDADGRLSDVDGLPYSLDLLMLEELDFLQNCLRSKTVKEEFVKELQTSHLPLEQLIRACIGLAQITSEEEGMWEFDYNIFA